MTRNLPEFPNLDHLKKQAKVLLRRMQGRDPAARLAKAQRALALEYGFASWPRLKAHVESMPRSEAPGGGGTTSGTMGPRQGPGGGDGLFPRFTEKARRTIFSPATFPCEQTT